MDDQQKIAQYIESISRKKNVFGKVSTTDVQEVICELSSMYNEMLTNIYNENERLKRVIDDMDDTKEEEEVVVQTEEPIPEAPSEEVEEPKEEETEEALPLPSAEESTLIDKDLRKFKRTELLELLLEQSRENEKQKEQIADLNRTISQMQVQLEDRAIRIDKAGTIAEAAFALNGVYDSAHAAAQQYLESLALLYEREQKNCIEKEARTEAYVKMRLEEVERACALKEKKIAARCIALEQATRERCAFMKEDVIKKCQEIEERTRAKCLAREKEAEMKCKELDQKAQIDVEKRWDILSQRLEEFYFSYDSQKEKEITLGEYHNK